MLNLEMINVESQGKIIPVFNKENLVKLLSSSEEKLVSNGKLKIILDEFSECIKEGYYPKEALTIDGHTIICFKYPFLHFMANRSKYKNKYLKKTITPFNESIVKNYQLMGA